MRKVKVQHFVDGALDFVVDVTLHKNRPPFADRHDAFRFLLGGDRLLASTRPDHIILSFSGGAFLFSREEIIAGFGDG